ncbi:hypothetical protein QFZ79_002376 [Arthrobacter sp. V4I6]|uniref:hypothetical protein n=1 Tax=unclassified Arthrobacter TaxID=235627 RepID=UPI00278604A5|nr:MULTISPECIES: hypothetical protein [unclassified Arthrobacter]MDQ0820083.1 hypothetical protein [Arthrobacter sp. V1I7]MDQ0854265.1 hypothetical protein [Arthrobacter sp. V4I6]
MRTFVSAVAVLIGLAMAAVAVPAMWVDRNIVQEDGFVTLTAPLGKDPAFQQRLAAAAVNSFSPDQVPESVVELIRPVLEDAAQSLTGLPGYSEAWTETLRKSHRLSFADPNSLPAEMQGVSSLTLDVAPLVGLVAKRVAEATSLPLESPAQVLITIGQPSQRQVIEQVSAYAPMGYAVAVGSAIAFVLAFVAARRRWTVLAGAGAGALLLSGVWTLAADAVGRAVERTSSGNAMAEIFKREFVAASTSGFGQWTLAAAVAGAVLLALGIVLRAVGGRRRP